MAENRAARGIVVGIAIAGVLVAGCGSGGGKAKTVPNASASSTTGSASASAGVKGPLTAKLLTAPDLPTGYSVDTATTSTTANTSTTNSTQLCKELDSFQTTYKAAERAEATFQKGTPSLLSVAEVIEGLDRYQSSSDATKAFDGFVSAAGKCKSFEQVDSDGSKTTGQFSSLSFPKLGDDTFAVHYTATEAQQGGLSLSVGGDFVVVRKGDVIMVVASTAFGTGSVPPSELEQIVRSGYKKLTA